MLPKNATIETITRKLRESEQLFCTVVLFLDADRWYWIENSNKKLVNNKLNKKNTKPEGGGQVFEGRVNFYWCVHL